MGALIIVILEPLILFLLKLFDRAVPITAEGSPEEFGQDSAVKPLHETLCPRRGYVRFSVFSVIKLDKNLIE